MLLHRSRRTFLASLGATIAVAPPRIASAQAAKVRIAGLYVDAFAEPYYATEAGAFAKAGLDLEVSNFSNAGAVAAALAGGSLDLGTGDLVSGVNAINAGLPIVLLAGGGLYTSSPDSDGFILGVLKASPIRQPRDLIGMTIGVPTLVGLTTASLRAWLPQNGVDLASVKIVEIPQSAAFPALQRGVINVALLSEPFITPFKDDIRDVGHPMDAIAKEFVVAAWFASKTWVDADRDRARRAVNAIYATARWANANRPETFAILVRDGKLDGDRLRGMIRIQYATTLTPALVQPVLNTATQSKIFDHQIDAGALIYKL